MIKSLSAGMGVALMALLLPNALALNSSGLPAGMLTQLTPKTAIVMNPSQSGSLEKTSDQDSNTRNESTAAQGDGALIIHHQVFYLRRVTAYNALPSQTNSNPGMSACGPTRPDQIALSPDLFFRSNGSNRCGEKINIVLSSGKIIIFNPDSDSPPPFRYRKIRRSKVQTRLYRQHHSGFQFP